MKRFTKRFVPGPIAVLLLSSLLLIPASLSGLSAMRTDLDSRVL